MWSGPVAVVQFCSLASEADGLRLPGARRRHRRPMDATVPSCPVDMKEPIRTIHVDTTDTIRVNMTDTIPVNTKDRIRVSTTDMNRVSMTDRNRESTTDTIHVSTEKRTIRVSTRASRAGKTESIDARRTGRACLRTTRVSLRTNPACFRTSRRAT